MVSEEGGAAAGVGVRVANVDDASSSSLLCEVAFDCGLVTCSCYLPLLRGLTQSPLPRTKGERVDGGEPIIGQAALIVWLNSWLTEWEMGGRASACWWKSDGEEALNLGCVPSRRALVASSLGLEGGAHSFSGAPSLSLCQHLYGALNILGSIQSLLRHLSTVSQQQRYSRGPGPRRPGLLTSRSKENNVLLQKELWKSISTATRCND